MERIELPEAVSLIINRLSERGFDAYAVGGCVRDSIMGITPHDWDICTSAFPEQIIEVFSNLKVIPTGIKHGTVTVVIEEDEFEITTYRIDGEYKDNRHQETVEFVQDLRLDLMRRDFTINAMAYNHKTGIIDYFNGIEDIQNGMIRCVGNPDERFSEDALRILRAIRFAVRLNFEIDQATRDSLFAHSQSLVNVSSERINSELTKTLQRLTFTTNQQILIDMITLLGVIVPEFKNCDINAISRRMLFSYKNLDVLLALLFDFDNESLENILRRLRFSNETIKSVTTINQYGRYIRDSQNLYDFDTKSITSDMYNKTDYFEKKLIHDIGSKLSLLSIMYASAFFVNDDRKQITNMLYQRVFRRCNESYSLSDLNVNGNDLLEIGFSGKSIGKTLNTILDMVMRDAVPNDHEKLIQIAKSIKEYLI